MTRAYPRCRADKANYNDNEHDNDPKLLHARKAASRPQLSDEDSRRHSLQRPGEGSFQVLRVFVVPDQHRFVAVRFWNVKISVPVVA
jgi:hypothetical protein